MTGNSVFTVLGDNEAGWGGKMRTNIKLGMIFFLSLQVSNSLVPSTYCPVQLAPSCHCIHSEREKDDVLFTVI